MGRCGELEAVSARRGLRMRRLHELPEWQQNGLIVASSILIGVVLYLTGLYPLYTVDNAVVGWVRAFLFCCICAVELLRRRTPIVALAVGLVLVLADGIVSGLSGLSLPMLIVFADLLYAGTLYGSPKLSRNMTLVALVSTLGVVVGAQILVPNWRVTVLTGLAAIPFIVVPVWLATTIRQHQAIAAAERTNGAQLAKIVNLDRTAAVAAERVRMAQDLHDVIAGHVSAIAIQSEAVLYIDEAKPDVARAVLVSVRENSLKALNEMRAMISLLRTQGSEDSETAQPVRLTALSALVESARASGMRLDVRLDIDDRAALPPAIDLTAYRIAQEALTNIMKHAPSAKARLDISRLDGTLSVEVVNECTAGSSAEIEPGNGLRNMRERAAAVGGSFSAGPSDSHWVVRADIPTRRAQL